MHSDGENRDVFFSRFNRFWAVVIWALDAAVVTGVALWQQGIRQPLWLIPAALFAYFAWAVLWRPRVVVDDAGVELDNVLRRVRVPWAALIHIDTRFALTLITPRRRYSAWAAPAPGRTGAAVARRRERRVHTPRLDGLGNEVRPGDLVATESGEAAYLVRARWQELREAGALPVGVADSTPVEVHVHWLLAVVFAVLLVASALVVGYA